MSTASDTPLAEIYFLASKARSKLTREASKNNHNLRVLVSHANLLDNLMESLSKKRTAGISQKPVVAPVLTHDTPITTIQEEDEEEYSSSDDEEYEYDQDSDEEDDDFDSHLGTVVSVFPDSKNFRQLPTIDEAPLHEIQVVEVSNEEDSDSDEESAYSHVSTMSIKSTASSESVPSLSYSSEEESDDDFYSAPASKNNHTTTVIGKQHHHNHMKTQYHSRHLVLPESGLVSVQV